MPRNAHPDSTFSSHVHNDWTNVQLGVEEIDHFIPNFGGATSSAGEYDREMPRQYTEERDDRLMNSLIKTYAIEMKDESGNPSGHMFLNKEAARKVSAEVVSTHMKFDDKDGGAEYLAEKFPETWAHFDVNTDGIVEVERMPQFLRFLVGNSLTIGLQ